MQHVLLLLQLLLHKRARQHVLLLLLRVLC